MKKLQTILLFALLLLVVGASCRKSTRVTNNAPTEVGNGTTEEGSNDSTETDNGSTEGDNNSTGTDNGSTEGDNNSTETDNGSTEGDNDPAEVDKNYVEELGTVPTWSVDEESYEYSMTYVSQISFDGNSPTTNTDVVVGAFCGNECRGVANLKFEEGMGIYVFHLSIYGNVLSGETITIKVYNPDKKWLYKQCARYDFIPDASLGNVSDILNCFSRKQGQ